MRLTDNDRMVLCLAADLVEISHCRGWSSLTVDGAVAQDPSDAVSWCALGAIWEAARVLRLRETEAVAAVAARVGHVATWNDNPRTSKATVVRTLRELAARPEREGRGRA